MARRHSPPFVCSPQRQSKMPPDKPESRFVQRSTATRDVGTTVDKTMIPRQCNAVKSNEMPCYPKYYRGCEMWHGRIFDLVGMTIFLVCNSTYELVLY